MLEPLCHPLHCCMYAYLLQPHAAQLILITSDVRSRMHETYLALQFSIDLTPLPPDHLGEPDTPYAICTFSFRLKTAITGRSVFMHCSQFYYNTADYGRPLILLKTHVVLVRVACGSNIRYSDFTVPSPFPTAFKLRWLLVAQQMYVKT